ncbi:PREDICTED: uncharacterized protein LOC106751487, partial [Dinoponera quadriceps]|uniref:Uncharacterized protein LOC106751487 n=1 Tax=Dinoponera quadriceps TaxID=609295 RepID=A0A6P3YA30_DINQU
MQNIIDVSIAILLASNVKLMQENTSQLLLKILALNNVELLYFAVENLMHYPLFEMLILPHILRRSVSAGIDSKTLLLFAKLISAKASPCLSGVALDK